MLAVHQTAQNEKNDKNIQNQSTVDGVMMVTGQNVLPNVEEESRRDAGLAIVLLPLTVGQTVREKLRKHKLATKTPAQVRTYRLRDCRL